MAGSARRRLGLAALSLGSLAAGGLVLEGLVRIVYRDEVDDAALRAALADTNLAAYTRPGTNPELVYELRPDVDLIGWSGVRLKTDRDGWCRIAPGRPGEQGEQGAPEFRIAILGDSSSFGWKIPFEQSYGEVLRSLLERSSGRRVWIRNFSVPGYNSHHNWITFRDRALSWRPHLVILHYDHNDTDRIYDKPPDYMEPEYGDNPLGSMLVKFVHRRLRRLHNARMTSAVEDTPQNPEKFFQLYRYAGNQFDRQLGELKNLAELAGRHGIPVIAFIFNTWLQRHDRPESDPFYTLLHRPVAERLAGWGFRVVDGYPYYQALMRENGLQDLSVFWVSRSPLDGHPNAEGHRFIAGLLHDVVKRELETAQLSYPPE